MKKLDFQIEDSDLLMQLTKINMLKDRIILGRTDLAQKVTTIMYLTRQLYDRHCKHLMVETDKANADHAYLKHTFFTAVESRFNIPEDTALQFEKRGDDWFVMSVDEEEQRKLALLQFLKGQMGLSDAAIQEMDLLAKMSHQPEEGDMEKEGEAYSKDGVPFESLDKKSAFKRASFKVGDLDKLFVSDTQKKGGSADTGI